MGEDRTATMTTRLELGAERPGLRLGFTLTELLVVITIIGIILAFLLTAADGRDRRAEERATQSLITKLEGGLNDRLDALMQNQPTPNYAHGYLAGVYPGTGTEADDGPLMLPSALLTTVGSIGIAEPQVQHAPARPGDRHIRLHQGRDAGRLLLDPAFLSNPGGYSGAYPINFTGLPFPGTAVRHPRFVLHRRALHLAAGAHGHRPAQPPPPGLDLRLWRCPRRPHDPLPRLDPSRAGNHRQRD